MKNPPFSINNKLILTPYKMGQGLKSEIRNGVAYVQQKSILIGLEVLIEARLEDGSFVPAGAIAYIAEDTFSLTTSKWAKDVRKCEVLGDREFIVVDRQNIILFDTKEEIPVSS